MDRFSERITRPPQAYCRVFNHWGTFVTAAERTHSAATGKRMALEQLRLFHRKTIVSQAMTLITQAW